MTDVRITGVDDLKRALAAVGRDAPRAMRAAARQVARLAAREAKGTAPVRTGALRKSIGQRESRGGVFYAGVRKGVFGWTRTGRPKEPSQYAYVVEKKRKFFSIAMERVSAIAPAEYLRALREALAKIMRRSAHG